MDFIEERNADLYRQYLNIISTPTHPTADEELFSLVANAPARQFYISIRKALSYINALDRGELLFFSHQQKAEQIRDIYSRYRTILPRLRNHRKTFIVQQVILSPAPKFYLSWMSVREIITRYNPGTRR